MNRAALAICAAFIVWNSICIADGNSHLPLEWNVLAAASAAFLSAVHWTTHTARFNELLKLNQASVREASERIGRARSWKGNWTFFGADSTSGRQPNFRLAAIVCAALLIVLDVRLNGPMRGSAFDVFVVSTMAFGLHFILCFFAFRKLLSATREDVK